MRQYDFMKFLAKDGAGHVSLPMLSLFAHQLSISATSPHVVQNAISLHGIALPAGLRP
jgi:hypothetical protein